MILHAEAEYSQKRLRSLFDEWYAEFPELQECVRLLKHLPAQFRLDAIDDPAVGETCLALAATPAKQRGRLSEWATLVVDQKMLPSDFRARLASVFYRIGVVGLKTEKATEIGWSFLHAPVTPVAAIRDDCTVALCPVFYRALGINPASEPK